MNAYYRVVAAATLVFVAACGGKSEQMESGSDSAPSTESAVEARADTTAAPALAAEQNERVQRAVTLAKAIQNDPAAAVTILAEQGLTPEQWSALLEEIARDPALAAAYEAGMR